MRPMSRKTWCPVRSLFASSALSLRRLLASVAIAVFLVSPDDVLAQHVFTAPHGGTLVAIGSEFAHVELVHDADTGELTVYLLGGEAKRGLRLVQETIEIDLLADSKRDTIVLRAVANPLTGESAGDSSEFRGRSDLLRGLTTFDGVIRRLEIKGAPVSELTFNVPLGANQHRDLLIGARGDAGATLALLQGTEVEADATLASDFGGVELFSATQPGFGVLVRPEASDGLVPLASGTEVSMEIVAVDPGTAAIVVGTRLDGAGDKASLGAAPDLHLHPSWLLALTSEDTTEATITFRLISSSPDYSASDPIRLRLTVRR